MQDKVGEGEMPGGETRQRPPQFATWIDRAATGLARESGALAVRSALLARLERFGLAFTGKPLFEPKRERT